MGKTTEQDTTEVTISMRADLLRSDLVLGHVWFVNYAAIDPTCVSVKDLDLNGTAMLPDDVKKFAHRWLQFSRSVDINHDGVGRPVQVIESFFNSKLVASPAFPLNAHAANLDVSRSKEAHDGLRNGTLNSVSLDALTFNKVIRVPVSAQQSSQQPDERWAVPTNLSAWALELAQDGYDGVTGMREITPGLHIAMRASGSPVAVAVYDDGFDASGSPADDPWGRLAATLYSTPSLVRSKLFVDFAPWDPKMLAPFLKEAGVNIDGNVDRLGPVEREVFAAVDEVSQRGFLPHHTVRGGQLSVSRDGVRSAMANLSSVPEHLREAARAHLSAHMTELVGAA